MSVLIRFAMFALLFNSLQGLSQPVLMNAKRECHLLKRLILTNHSQPRKVDDAFSTFVFDSFLAELDPDRLYFSQSDINMLQSFRSGIDDEVNNVATWTFLDQTTLLYKKCLERSAGRIETVLKGSFTWSSKDSPLRIDTMVWAMDDEENLKNWERWLKYKTLHRLYDLMAMDSSAASSRDFVQQHESTVRSQVKGSEVRSINRVLNHPSGFENYVATTFLRCIANAFDPHSVYMSSDEMENFMASMSSEGFSFGLSLDENQRDEVIISYLIPGGPAWKSGELHVSDVMMYLKWEKGDVIDLYGMSADEINALLEETNHDQLEITVRKEDGMHKKVTLRKEKLSLEENVVRSFVLKDEQSIGYISLPGFYSDWDDSGEGQRCANDVAKEILKLKDEKIEGLILDLRYNGGGSLLEALAMAGIFIEEGPLGIVKDRTGLATTVKDLNRGTVYDGPLLIMVNHQSASASEFLAAALQDYERALIVGSRTFGKATAQNMFALDPAAKDLNDALQNKRGYGFATVTVNKIYRVTGGSIQGSGLKPDFALPDLLDKLNVSESAMPMALEKDSVSKKTYYRPLPSLHTTEIKQNSEQRIKNNEAFTEVHRMSEWLYEKRKQKLDFVPLTWSEYINYEEQWTKNLAPLVSKLSVVKPPFTVLNNRMDAERMEIDGYTSYLNSRWSENLMKDIYLSEAFQIIQDYIQFNK